MPTAPAPDAIALHPLRPAHYAPPGARPRSAADLPGTSPVHALQALAYPENPEYHETNAILASYPARTGARGFLASAVVRCSTPEEAREWDAVAIGTVEGIGVRVAVGYIYGYPLDPEAAMPELHHPVAEVGVPAWAEPDAGGGAAGEDKVVAEEREARLEWAAFRGTGAGEPDVPSHGSSETLASSEPAKLAFYLADRTVHPAFQRRGIGSLLLDALVASVARTNAAAARQIGSPVFPRMWAMSVNAAQVANLERAYGFASPLSERYKEPEGGYWGRVERERAGKVPDCFDHGEDGEQAMFMSRDLAL